MWRRQNERRCLYGRICSTIHVLYPGSDPWRLTLLHSFSSEKQKIYGLSKFMSVGIKTETLQDVPCGFQLIETSAVVLACSKNFNEVTDWLPVREHPVAVRFLTHPAGLRHVAEGFLVGHYLRCGDEHIALISSAIISSGQTGAVPAKAGRLSSLLLTYLRFLTDSLFAHFHCGNKIRSNYKVLGLSVHSIIR